MAAYRRVYDSRHLQADCQEPGSEHTLGIRVWAIPFYSLCIELSYFLIGLSLIFICVDNDCCCGFVSLYRVSRQILPPRYGIVAIFSQRVRILK